MRSGMLQAETWKLAWDALRTNKMRAMLTMLGVVIGSGCIVLVVTVALAGKQYIIGQIEGVGANLVYAELILSSASQPSALADQISLDDLEAVKQRVPQVVEAAGTRNIPTTVVGGSVEHPINLVGVTQGFQQIRNLAIERGRYFDQDDMLSHSKVCLL